MPKSLFHPSQSTTEEVNFSIISSFIIKPQIINAQNIWIYDSIFESTENPGKSGGAIFVDCISTNFAMNHTLGRGTTAGDQGGFLAIKKCSTCTITDTCISNSSAVYSAFFYLENQENITVDTISFNLAHSSSKANEIKCKSIAKFSKINHTNSNILIDVDFIQIFPYRFFNLEYFLTSGSLMNRYLFMSINIININEQMNFLSHIVYVNINTTEEINLIAGSPTQLDHFYADIPNSALVDFSSELVFMEDCYVSERTKVNYTVNGTLLNTSKNPIELKAFECPRIKYTRQPDPTNWKIPVIVGVLLLVTAGVIVVIWIHGRKKAKVAVENNLLLKEKMIESEFG